jgi:hypothetical protein
MTKRLIYVTTVMSCALGLAGGSGYARARRPGTNPQHPSMTCVYKTIGVKGRGGNRKRKLSFFYDLKRLTAAVKPRRDYEVTALPGGDEVRISRTFDGVKYNIIFEGGDSLSFDLNTGRNSGGSNGASNRREKCGTPERRIRSRVYRMIEDLPLDDRQKAELRGYVAVVTVAYLHDGYFGHPAPPVAQPQDFSPGQPSDLKGLKKVYVETSADPDSRRRIIRELNKPELGLTLLDGPDGAEIILDFGSRTEHHDEKVDLYSYVNGTYGTTQVRREILTGRGRAFVVKDGKRRSVMSFENTKSTFWERDPATNFGHAFRKLYKKVNGIK